MGSRAMAVIVALGALFAMCAVPAQATFPGHNGRIAYVAAAPGGSGNDIWTSNSDGTDAQSLTGGLGGARPRWSPDGTKIAYNLDDDVYVIDADGSGRTNITNTPLTPFPASGFVEHSGAWSPDGTRLAFVRFEVTNGETGPLEIWIADADGSNPMLLETSTDRDYNPQWHPDGTRISFSGCFGQYCNPDDPYIISVDGSGEQPMPVEFNGDWSPDGARLVFNNTDGWPNTDVFSQEVDGSGLTNLTTDPGADRDPKWSPDGTKVVFWSNRGGNGPRIYTMNADGSEVTGVTIQAALDPDWQPIPVNSYPRPKGATPFQVYLVPAHEACASPNRTHGPPLASGSCNPPAHASTLTVGTPDANAKPAKSVSAVRFSTLAGTPSTPADEADLRIEASITDVYDRATLADYGSELAVSAPLQITDKLNTPHPGGPGPGTVTQAALGFPVSCAPTADTTVGARCALTTTLEAVIPGAVPEGKRSIWALGQVEVDDADGAPFLRQGVFVP